MTQKLEYFNVSGMIHLGDIIVCTNIIYNLALENDFIAKVWHGSKGIWKQLQEIFDYQDKIQPCARNKGLKYHFTIGKHLDIPSKAIWCHRRFGASSFKPVFLKNFKLPECRLKHISKNDYKCYQVNSRSHIVGKPRLNYSEIKKILNLFDEGNSYFLSKSNTKIFIPNVKVHLANLVDQSKFLLGCKSFFGVDSGMSHLAGTLRVSGDIVAQGTYKKFTNCIQQAYGFMYPSFKVYSRNILREDSDLP